MTDIKWLMLTTKDRPYLARTLPAWSEVLDMDCVVIDGSGGYVQAMRKVMDTAARFPWVFFTEDDFMPLPGLPDLGRVCEVAEANGLAQMVLKRQPWYLNEITAGGVLHALDGPFIHRSGWVEHRAFWSCNPCLFPGRVAARGWPDGPWSEAEFGRRLFEDGHRVGMWGSFDSAPVVEHIGFERVGGTY